jgi:hypothetical protein
MWTAELVLHRLNEQTFEEQRHAAESISAQMGGHFELSADRTPDISRLDAPRDRLVDRRAKLGQPVVRSHAARIGGAEPFVHPLPEVRQPHQASVPPFAPVSVATTLT